MKSDGRWGKPITLKTRFRKDDRGTIAFLEQSEIPFSIKRVYWLFDVSAGAVRGSHAHKRLQQIYCATAGSLEVQLDDGTGERFSFLLNDPRHALYVPSGYWRTLSDFSAGASLMVIASDAYDESDYIRDYDEFLIWKLQS